MADGERKTGSIQAYERGWMITLGVIIAIGALIVVVVTLTAENAAFAFAVGLLLAGACLLIGGLIGFLFGIPRALQGDGAPEVEESEDEGKEDSTKRRRTAYRANTNLEQISDWLTKILVGVGLTQIGDAPAELLGAAKYIGPALGGGDSGERLAVGVMLYFPTAGFFFGYLWTRLFLAGALARADLEAALAAVEKQVQEQPQFDAAALAAVQQYLTDPTCRVSAAEVKKAIEKASPMVKVQIFYLAKKMRKENWESNKVAMERTIPIFEALIESDVAGNFHKNHGQLGYALKDKREPDYAQAEAALTKAIRIRGPWQQAGWVIYEANRAECRIELDAEFKEGKPSTPKNRLRIIEDLTVVATTDDLVEWLDRPPYSDWMKLNQVNVESLVV